MPLRRRFLFVAALVLGIAAAALPVAASSETIPTVEGIGESGEGVYKVPPHWSPERTELAQPGTLTFANRSSTVPHGIVWSSPVLPACEGSVPVGTFKTSWSGTCTFTKAGEYTFYCAYHGPSMHGVVIVAPGGQVTTSTTPAPPGASGGATTPPPASPQPAASAAGSPLAGSASSAVKLSYIRGSSSLGGSVDVAAAGTGGRLQVDVLTRSASLARSGQVRIGTYRRTALPAGVVHFRVALSARARRALRRHGHLAVLVRLTLTPAQGAAVNVSRTVTLKR
jgi:plastocyanin